MGYGHEMRRLVQPACTAFGIAVALFAFAGCGTVPQVVGATSQAAFAPLNTLAWQGRQGLQTVNRSVTTVSQTAKVMSRDVTRSVGFANSQVNNTVNNVRYLTRPTRPVRPALPKPTELTSSQRSALAKNRELQKEALKKSKTAEQPDLPMLPEQTLAKLTVDQAGLQNAAQKVALTAPVGEVIFWDNEGRSGEVLVDDEHKLGNTLCRSFEQAITIDGTVEEARGVACRDDDSGRWALAF